MTFNSIKSDVISFLARTYMEKCINKNCIKWVKIAKCSGDISMSKFILFIDNLDINFACDLAIIITESNINCIGVSSSNTSIALDKEGNLYLGFKYNEFPKDYRFSYSTDNSVNISYFEKLTPLDKIPEDSKIVEVNK